MRFRRKRRSHTRRPGMKGDWVVGADFNCFTEGVIPVEQLCNSEFEGNAPFGFSLLDSQDLSDKEDALTVVRIVGDIPMVAWYFEDSFPGSSLSLFTIVVREGIYLAGSDGQLPTGTVDQLDPRLPGDFQLDTWLWMRTRAWKFSAVNTSTSLQAVVQWQSGADYAGQPAQNDHIDLRVKRRLKRGQELIYVVGGYHETLEGVAPDASKVHAAMTAHLRCYVKF